MPPSNVPGNSKRRTPEDGKSNLVMIQSLDALRSEIAKLTIHPEKSRPTREKTKTSRGTRFEPPYGGKRPV